MYNVTGAVPKILTGGPTTYSGQFFLKKKKSRSSHGGNVQFTQVCIVLGMCALPLLAMVLFMQLTLIMGLICSDAAILFLKQGWRICCMSNCKLSFN